MLFRSSKTFKTFHGVCHIILVDQPCQIVKYGNVSKHKLTYHWKIPGIDGLVGWGGGGKAGTQLLTCCDSIGYALELLQSFVKPSIWCASNTKLWHMDLRNWYYSCFWTRWLVCMHMHYHVYSNDTCEIVTYHINIVYMTEASSLKFGS